MNWRIFVLVFVCSLPLLGACGGVESAQAPYIPPESEVATPTYVYPTPVNFYAPTEVEKVVIPSGVDVQPTFPPQEAVGMTVIADGGSAEYIPHSFGVVVNKEFRIVYIEQGSTAEKAGFQQEDKLVSLDGLLLSEKINTVRQMLSEPNTKHKMQIVRDGETMSIDFVTSARVVYALTPTPVLPPDNYF